MNGKLLEGYIGRWTKYPKDEIKIRVARPSVLSPSKHLFKDIKDGEIDLDTYEIRFRKEIFDNPKALAKIDEIKTLLSNGKNVRLICYEKNPPCHRFLLIDIIKTKPKKNEH